MNPLMLFWGYTLAKKSQDKNLTKKIIWLLLLLALSFSYYSFAKICFTVQDTVSSLQDMRALISSSGTNHSPIISIISKNSELIKGNSALFPAVTQFKHDHGYDPSSVYLVL
jgi:hypothetical protein